MFRKLLALVALAAFTACEGTSPGSISSLPGNQQVPQSTSTLMSTDAQRAQAANAYWATHSIPFNDASKQTVAERQTSQYYQAKYRAMASAARPEDNCLQLKSLTASPADTPCCSQSDPTTCGNPPNNLPSLCGDGPCITVSACPSGATCIWGNNPGGFGPWSAGAGGNSPCNPQQHSDGCVVAIHKGAPSDGQTCIAGTNDMAIGDTVGLVGGQDRSIVDENLIFQADGLPYNVGGKVTVNSHVWGFLYKDNAGQFWIQTNTAFAWTSSFSARAHLIIGA